MNNWDVMERKQVRNGLQSPTARSCGVNGIADPSTKARGSAFGWQLHLCTGALQGQEISKANSTLHEVQNTHEKVTLHQGP